MNKAIVLLILALMYGSTIYADTLKPDLNSTPASATVTITQQSLDSLIAASARSTEMKQIAQEEAKIMFNSYTNHVGWLVGLLGTVLAAVVAVVSIVIPYKINRRYEKEFDKMLDKMNKQVKKINKKINKTKAYAEEYAEKALASSFFSQAMYEKDNDKKIALLSEAIKKNPKFAESYNESGKAYYAKGDRENSITNYKKAIKANPNYAEPNYNLGNVLIHTDSKSAKDYLKKAIQYRQV